MNRSQLVLASLTACLLTASSASAQVNGPGPSNPDFFSTVINLPGDPVFGDSIGDFQSFGNIGSASPTTQINVADDGSVGFSFEANSGIEVNISGGSLGSFFDANSGSVVNISGGTVGRNFAANSGSVVNISGGIVANGIGGVSDFEANSGSVVNISGGTVEADFEALSGSEVNISGGTVGDHFVASSGSDVSINGGTVGDNFFAAAGSDVELIGGEFLLNGVVFTGQTISLSVEDLFTGTLEDGSAFVFTAFAADYLPSVTLTQATSLPIIDLTPQFISTDISMVGPSGLRAGQAMTLQNGGILGNNFALVDAALDIEGGQVGKGLETARSVVNISGGTVAREFRVSDSEVNISGGTVYRFFEAFSGSVVNISGGTVEAGFDAESGSVVNISGGTVGRNFRSFGSVKVNITGGTVGIGYDVNNGSEVNISGGTVGDHFDVRNCEINISGGNVGDHFGVFSGSVVNISGGTVGEHFIAQSGSEVNLVGTEFRLNGVLLDTPVAEEAFTINNRNVILSGLLADGSPFSFDLNDSFVDLNTAFVNRDAMLTVTVVPEPPAVGDFNGDETVDLVDLDQYNQHIGSAATGALAALDLDGDGIVGANDFARCFAELVVTSNGQTGTFAGDIDLNGEVNVLGDGFVLISNLNISVNSWGQGDVNADGVVNVLGDGFPLISNLGMTNEP